MVWNKLQKKLTWFFLIATEIIIIGVIIFGDWFTELVLEYVDPSACRLL